MSVLFIVIDQLRADLLTGALAAHVDLPHLRALARDAVTFENHHTVANPCGPSRASLLTGQYAMNHRSVRNGAPLRHDAPTLPGELRRAGIDPLLFGYTDTSLDPRVRGADDPPLVSYENPMPGFDEVVEMQLETSRPWRDHLAAQGYECPDYAEFYVPVAAPGRTRRLTDPAFYRAEDSDTAYLTDRLLDHMDRRGWEGVLAHLTYLRPHPPLVAPAPYNALYDPGSVPAPETLPGDLAAHPFLAVPPEGPWAANMVDGFPDLQNGEAAARALRAVYFGLATEVDHHIGRVIAHLKAAGVYDETLIVVTGDHGEMLGDHGVWGKTTLFDAAWRVPLILRDPRRPEGFGTAVRLPTQSVDVLPTILDWLGLDVPASVNGRSLAGFLGGPGPDSWREESFSELAFGDPVTPTRWQRAHGLPHRDAQLAILRRGAHVLVQFACGYPPILFDMGGAGEARNLAQDADQAPVLHEMTQAMLVHRMRHPDTTLSDIQITPEGPVG